MPGWPAPLINGGRVRGVVLENGEEILAPVVVTTLHPRTAFLDHINPSELPADFVQDIERWKTRSGVVKINLALSELPNFTADPGTELAEHHTGSVEMAPSIEYMERAFQDAREGRAAERPFSDGVIPTTFDKTLCPDGTHIMSLFTQWVPKEWSETPHTEELEAYADRMIDCYDEVAPNFKASILHRDVVGPYEMEQEYGLIGGNIFHGELSRRAAVPHAAGARLRRLPHPDRGPLQRQLGDPRRRRRVRYPGLAGGQGGAGRQEGGAGTGRSAAGALPTGGDRTGRCDRRPDAAVRAMLEPRRVAVVGASGDAGELRRAAGRPRWAAARRPLEVHLVNPRYDDIGGPAVRAVAGGHRRSGRPGAPRGAATPPSRSS